MDAEEEIIEEDIDDISRYIAQFRRHLLDTAEHLEGVTPEVYADSYVFPRAYWTCAEKRLFFHALSIHSRWRPDLIADCVGTKTILDVCTYIDLLEDGQSKISQQKRICRNDMDTAIAVSSWWTKVEEKSAQYLEERESAIPMVQRKRKAEDGMVFLEEDSCGSSNISPEKKAKLEAMEVERILDQLQLPHCDVLDSILCAGEEVEATPASASLVGVRQDSAGLLNTDGTPAPPGTPSHEDADDEDKNNLDPKSRRRLMKRLYMRRKRAERGGTEFSTDPAKQRRGRKAMLPVVTHTSAPDLPIDEPAQDNESKSNFSERSSSQIASFEQIKMCFKDGGIEKQFLEQHDMNFFHFGALHRLLMRANTGAHPRNFSSQYIAALTCIVKAYVRRLVHLAIISRELEIKLKGGKVWKLKTTDVMAANVRHALEQIGTRDSGEASSDYTSSNIFLLPLRRELNAPFIYHPVPENTNVSNESLDAPSTEDISDEEDLLDQEMKEDNILDEHDCNHDRAEERILWKQLGRKPPTRLTGTYVA